MSAKTQPSDNKQAQSAGLVTITLYGVDYVLPVNSDLPGAIRKIVYEANRGRKGYRTPSTEVIRERLVRPWKLRNTDKPVKTEFSSPETKGFNVPFAMIKFA